MSHKICLYHPQFYLIHSIHKYALFFKTFGIWFIISYFMEILNIVTAYKIYIKVSWKTLPLYIWISEIQWLLLSLYFGHEIDGYLLAEPFCYTVQPEMLYDLSSLLFSKFLAELIYVHYNWTKHSWGSLLTSVVFTVLIYSPSVSCQNSKATCPFVLSLYHIKQQNKKTPTDSG